MTAPQSRAGLLAKLTVAIFMGLSADVSLAVGASYDELKAAAVKTCQGVDPAEYQSGLLFNPDGYRSYYVRSECFQRIAVQFRDQTLCSRVKRRNSLFSSSWGYSSANCLKLVAEGEAADRKIVEEIKRRYAQGVMRLQDFRVEQNGNGRDFDIIPVFSGEFAHGYTSSSKSLTPSAACLSIVPAFTSMERTISACSSGRVTSSNVFLNWLGIVRTPCVQLWCWTLATEVSPGIGATPFSNGCFRFAKEVTQ